MTVCRIAPTRPKESTPYPCVRPESLRIASGLPRPRLFSLSAKGQRIITQSVPIVLALTCMLQLSGCSLIQTRSTGAPIQERGVPENVQAAPPKQSESENPDVVIKPYSSGGGGNANRVPDETQAQSEAVPAQQEQPAASNNAVLALLDNAGQQSRSGKLDSAAAALERALRIEPRNPEVWHRLAAIRLQQGQFDQAASLAAKSINLAGNNTDLITRNKNIIAQARRKQTKP